MTRNLSHKTITVEFSCEHTATFYESSPPKIGAVMVCRTCDRDVTVTRNDLLQWKVSCITCAHSSTHGLHGRLSAERAGARHRARKGNHDHVVEVLDPQGVLHHRFDNQGQLSIDQT